MPFTFESTSIPGVIIVTPRLFGDERGFFMETYKASEFKSNGIDVDFVQDNHSFSSKGVLRGLHFQRGPMAQGKLIRVMQGRVWDVAVDIRPDSPARLQWTGVELSDENNRMVYIPPGFAHGFLVLSDTAHFMYKTTAEYSPEHDGGIRWDDPDIGVEWPVTNPQVSEKDRSLPYLKDSTL